MSVLLLSLCGEEKSSIGAGMSVGHPHFLSTEREHQQLTNQSEPNSCYSLS